MTTPDVERIRGHIATLMTCARPDWDVAGCVAALRALPPDLPVAELVIGAMRYSTDPANLTPAHLADFRNRAWAADWYPACSKHPDYRGRRTSGECGRCYAERVAVEYRLPDRGGRPIPDEARRTIANALHATPETTEAK